jgi:SPX domain protein involved in polyphosphate accumulation
MKTSSPFVSRYEIKYAVPESSIMEISRMLRLFAVHDPFTPPSKRMEYTVRSVYYDTPTLEFYYQKLDGLKVRKKLRIRTYGHEKDIAFLEIKRRYTDIVVKERVKLHYDQIESLVRGDTDWLSEDAGHPHKTTLIAGKFLYSLLKMRLMPTLLVIYDREAFAHPLIPTQRATIDHSMRYVPYPVLGDLFQTDGLVRITEPQAILELKFNDFMPKWMRRLESAFHLRQQSVSKYTLGIDACRGDIHKEVASCRPKYWKISS